MARMNTELVNKEKILDNERARIEQQRVELEEQKQQFLTTGKVNTQYKQRYQSFTLGMPNPAASQSLVEMNYQIPVNFGQNYLPSEVEVKTLAHDTGGQCIAFSPLGKKIATAGADGKVKLWEMGLQSNKIL